MREARDLAVFLISLHAVAHALFAWDGQAVSQPLIVGWWAVLLGAGLMLGEWLGPRLLSIVDLLGGKRFRVAATTAYVLLVIVALPMVGAAPSLIARQVVLFAALQPALLLLASSERGVLASVENALVLVVFASLRGGALAAVAVTGYVGLLAAFLVLEHYGRALDAHPRSRVPPLHVVARRAAGAAAPPVVLMSALFLALPPTPYVPAALAAPAPVALEEIAAAYQLLTVLGLIGGGSVYLLARWLRRARRGEPPVMERLEARRVDEELVALPEALRRPDYPGPRGRVVRAYLGFLAQAARLAVRRRPSATPREFALHLREPSEPLRVLTDLFVRARYGPDAPGESEARAAERAAELIVAALRRPQKDRPASRLQ